MRSIRVLIVDDHAAFLCAAKTFMSSLPHVEVQACAESAAAGLTQAASLAPDLVLMDLAMPGMNGLDAVRILKQAPSAPKAVIVTLHDTQAYRSAARAAGADGFVAKSNFAVDLPPLLETLFAGQQP